MGFAHLNPLKVTRDLYDFAALRKGVYADIGAAYGIDSIALVKRGAQVVAIDLDQHHLDFLKEQLNEEELNRLEMRCQRFPEDVHLEEAFYDGVLLSRVLLFLSPDHLDQALNKVYRSLKPGGRVYVITVSPYSKGWDPVRTAFENHTRLLGSKPFLISNLWDVMPKTQTFLPNSIQLFDQEILSSLLKYAGFKIMDSGYESHHGTEDVYAIGVK